MYFSRMCTDCRLTVSRHISEGGGGLCTLPRSHNLPGHTAPFPRLHSPPPDTSSPGHSPIDTPHPLWTEWQTRAKTLLIPIIRYRWQIIKYWRIQGTPGPNSFMFVHFFAKNRIWALAPPPQINPGSATAKLSLLPKAYGVWGKVMFSQASVCSQVGSLSWRGGCLVWGVCVWSEAT